MFARLSSCLALSGCIALMVALSACASQPADAPAATPSASPSVSLALQAAAAPIPPGPDGDLIRYGHSLVTDTQHTAAKYVVSKMNCTACHLEAGTARNSGSLLGIYAQFPQYNARAHRFIALQDRIAECFLNSMNGNTPSYSSRDMIAIVAYIAFRSRGSEVGVGFPDQAYHEIAHLTPNIESGKAIYTAQCSSCHGATGAGVPPALPPLWGPTSFNDNAGMSHVEHMASFVRYNMPVGKEGSLSDQQAFDVAGWVLTHPRPHFNKQRAITFPPELAGFY